MAYTERLTRRYPALRALRRRVDWKFVAAIAFMILAIVTTIWFYPALTAPA